MAYKQSICCAKRSQRTKRKNAKKSGFEKQNGFQIVTRPKVRFNIVRTVCTTLLRFALSRFNSLIISFATQKVRHEQKYIQGVILRERQQGERRNCSHHGTSDNQRDCIAVQLQAEHSLNALGREREQGERQGQGGTGHQPYIGQHQGTNHQALPADIRP